MTKTRKPYWIIYSWKRGSIWEKPYTDEAECLTEFNAQMKKVREAKGSEFMKLVDWRIEQHWYDREITKSDSKFEEF